MIGVAVAVTDYNYQQYTAFLIYILNVLGLNTRFYKLFANLLAVLTLPVCSSWVRS